MWNQNAIDVMTESPKTINVNGYVKDIVNVLKNCKHNGFPVVSNNKKTFLGIITRDEL